jgi:hypothetical protein
MFWQIFPKQYRCKPKVEEVIRRHLGVYGAEVWVKSLLLLAVQQDKQQKSAEC